MQFVASPASAKQSPKDHYEINENETLKVSKKFRRKQIFSKTQELPGTVIVDPYSKFLYFILGKDRTIRSGVGVGRQDFEWSGEAVIRRKAKWPRWTPPKRWLNVTNWRQSGPMECQVALQTL